MPTLTRRLAQSSCIPALREGGELRPEAPVVILLGRAFPSVGSSRSPIKIFAAVMINRAALATPMIRTGKAGFMGKREPQMILKTDERSIVLELGHAPLDRKNERGANGGRSVPHPKKGVAQSPLDIPI